MNRKDFLYFFFILINIFSYSIQAFKNCAPVRIDPDEFDFTPIKKGLHFTMPDLKNNKIIQAFDYEDIDNIKNIFSNSIQGLIIQANVNEKKKLNFDVIFSGIGKMMSLLRNNEQEDEQIEIFFNKIESMVNNIPDKNLVSKLNDEIIKEKNEYKESLNKTFSESVKEKLVGSFLATFSGAGISTIAQYSLFSPQTVCVIFGGFLILSGIEKLYNTYMDSKTRLLIYNIGKFAGILEKLNNLMFEHKWVDNNAILTAYSNDNECFQNDVKFHYIKDFRPINTHGEEIDEDYYINMAMITCELKKNNCAVDNDECVDNLMAYNKCRVDKRGKKAETCSRFTQNCRLKEKKINES